MVGLLLPVALLLAGVYASRWVASRRDALLVGSAAFLLWVWILTEGLGVFHGLSLNTLLLGWLAAVGGLGTLLYQWLKPKPRQPFLLKAPRLTFGLDWIWGAPLLVLAGLLLVVSLVSPPNTYDVLTYHLPRVVHWAQAGSVDHYPTHILRQLYQRPFAEFVLLHLFILDGGDVLANLPQWAALLGCGVAASRVAQLLGAARAGQSIAAGVAATLPMAVLQSTGAKNDVFLGFLLLTAAALGLAATLAETTPRQRWILWGGASVMAGLSLLTKGTAFLYLPALAVLLTAVVFVRVRPVRTVLALVAVAVGTAVVLNAPMTARNFAVFGTAMGPGEENATEHEVAAPYANERKTLSVMAAHVVRNSAIQLTTPSEAWTARIRSAADRLIVSLGETPSDPGSSFAGLPFVLPWRDWADENFAGNPVHFTLTVLSGAVLVVWGAVRPRQAGLAAGYAIVIVVGFALFCIYLRWQIWGTRLLAPLLLMSAPLVGRVFGAVPLGLGHLVALGVVAIAWVYPFQNPMKPLTGPMSVFKMSRDDQYHQLATGPKPLQTVLRRSIDQLSTQKVLPRHVGVICGRDDLEYLLYLELNRLVGQRGGFRFTHYNVTNASNKLYPPGGPEVPDAVIDYRLKTNMIRVLVWPQIPDPIKVP